MKPERKEIVSETASELDELVRHVRERTPARLLTGRAGAAYRSSTQLQLREDHAAARDAVVAEFTLQKCFSPDFIAKWDLRQLQTEATTKQEYLLRPDLGR